jgi:hypothetical protein
MVKGKEADEDILFPRFHGLHGLDRVGEELKWVIITPLLRPAVPEE